MYLSLLLLDWKIMLKQVDYFNDGYIEASQWTQMSSAIFKNDARQDFLKALQLSSNENKTSMQRTAILEGA